MNNEDMIDDAADIAHMKHVEEQYEAAYEAFEKQHIAEQIAARIADLNEGDIICNGEYCDGKGRMTEDEESCAYCREIDYGIWKAGEPD